ncbi:MAG: hypothetical protein NTX72_05810 [Candidatus Uhrbacteria bacterium]|nr:hypothetical protein [Candidatus Uhrbacteria bacterium]
MDFVQILQQVLPEHAGKVKNVKGLEGVTLKNGQFVIIFGDKSLVTRMGMPVTEGGVPIQTQRYEFQHETGNCSKEGVLFVADSPMAIQCEIYTMGYDGSHRIVVAHRYCDDVLQHEFDPQFETNGTKEFHGSRWVRWTEIMRALDLKSFKTIAIHHNFLSGMALLWKEGTLWEEEVWDYEHELVLQAGVSQFGPEEGWLSNLPRESDPPEEITEFFEQLWVFDEELVVLQALTRFGVSGPLPIEQKAA